jgi:regulator of RNase E activity RraB
VVESSYLLTNQIGDSALSVYDYGMSASHEPHPISVATRKIIDELISHGLQRGRNYPIEFAFFGNRPGLVKLRHHLIAAGYKEDTGQSEEMLVFIRDVPLSYATIGEALAEMKELAETFGVSFDGWSCSV